MNKIKKNIELEKGRKKKFANKILILSSIETLLPHFILEKNLYSENYHLASNAYFGNNAIIFSQILNYNDLDSFDLFLKNSF